MDPPLLSDLKRSLELFGVDEDLTCNRNARVEVRQGDTDLGTLRRDSPLRSTNVRPPPEQIRWDTDGNLSGSGRDTAFAQRR